jgi:hypothetical protein
MYVEYGFKSENIFANGDQFAKIMIACFPTESNSET